MIEKIDEEVEKTISSSLITISEDWKKSVSCAKLDLATFTLQKILPSLAFTLNKLAEELSAISSPFLEIANGKRLCDFMKDYIVLTSQILVPSAVLKQSILLSWLITKIFSSKIFKFDLKGTPWFLNQISFPLSRLIA